MNSDSVPSESTQASVFRTHALNRRISSSTQFDELITVTRPADWMMLAVTLAILLVAGTWSVVGRIASTLSGAGIVLGDGDIVDAESAVQGHVSRIRVKVGERVKAGQVLATLEQAELVERRQHAAETLADREREQSELIAIQQRELQIKSANWIAERNRLNERMQLQKLRAQQLRLELDELAPMRAKGIATTRDIATRQSDLNDQLFGVADSQGRIDALKADQSDVERRQETDRQTAAARCNDARRSLAELGTSLGHGSEVLSPAAGRVLEIQALPGTALSPGSHVATIQTDGKALHAVVYVSATQAQNIAPGMQVRLTPATVRREEVGSLLATVESVSGFPSSVAGMRATLGNDGLATNMSSGSSPYGVQVRFATDRSTVSGYRWTSGKGPAQALTAGTLVEAEITTREQAPVTLVFPALRHFAGLNR